MIQHAMEQIAIGVQKRNKRISLSANVSNDEIMDLVTKWNRSDDIIQNLIYQMRLINLIIFSVTSDVESVIFF